MNILSAQIFSRTDGIALDTFYVTDVRTGLLATREEREKFEQYLKAALTGDYDLGAAIRRLKLHRTPYQSPGGERLPTVIQFDNGTSETRTVIDLETDDRVGLLYTVSRVMAELRLDISLAKICTEKGAASDSFYVQERDGHQIISAERQNVIDRRLRAAVASLDSAA